MISEVEALERLLENESGCEEILERVALVLRSFERFDGRINCRPPAPPCAGFFAENPALPLQAADELSAVVRYLS